MILRKIDSNQSPMKASESSPKNSKTDSSLEIRTSSSSSTEATYDETMDVTSTESSEKITDQDDEFLNTSTSSTESHEPESEESSDNSSKNCKFIPWFSDDEQATAEEEDCKENVNVSKRKRKLDISAGTIESRKRCSICYHLYMNFLDNDRKNASITGRPKRRRCTFARIKSRYFLR